MSHARTVYRLTKLGSKALKELVCLSAWSEANTLAIRGYPGFSNIPIHSF